MLASWLHMVQQHHSNDEIKQLLINSLERAEMNYIVTENKRWFGIAKIYENNPFEYSRLPTDHKKEYADNRAIVSEAKEQTSKESRPQKSSEGNLSCHAEDTGKKNLSPGLQPQISFEGMC